MLICFPGKGSGGGVVYGFGVWRVKSWVKNVLNANKYIAIFSIKWGWSRLTYLPLVVIIFEKSIILFYWTPYRGIDNFYSIMQHVFFVKAIEPLIGGLRPNRKGTAPQSVRYWTPYRGIDTYSTLDDRFWHRSTLCLCHYWTPYRGIDTISSSASAASSPLLNPYRGIDTHWELRWVQRTFPYWTPYRGIETPSRGGFWRFFIADNCYWTPYRGIETF